MPPQLRAGGSVEDFCRACKTDRLHTVIAVDAEGHALRVVCGYCHSEHNFRGGPRVGQESRGGGGGRRGAGGGSNTTPRGGEGPKPTVKAGREPFPIVSERERFAPPVNEDP